MVQIMKVLIFGATGMVGGEVLEQCLFNDKIQSVLTVGRQKSGVDHPILKEIKHDNFLDYSTLEPELKNIDVCFFCLGVYQAKVSKAQFWEITVDYLAALVRSFEVTNKTIRFCFSAHKEPRQVREASSVLPKQRDVPRKSDWPPNLRKNTFFVRASSCPDHNQRTPPYQRSCLNLSTAYSP